MPRVRCTKCGGWREVSEKEGDVPTEWGNPFRTSDDKLTRKSAAAQAELVKQKAEYDIAARKAQKTATAAAKRGLP